MARRWGTPAQKAALKRAQEISARKRRGTGKGDDSKGRRPAAKSAPSQTLRSAAASPEKPQRRKTGNIILDKLPKDANAEAAKERRSKMSMDEIRSLAMNRNSAQDMRRVNWDEAARNGTTKYKQDVEKALPRLEREYQATLRDIPRNKLEELAKDDPSARSYLDSVNSKERRRAAAEEPKGGGRPLKYGPTAAQKREIVKTLDPKYRDMFDNEVEKEAERGIKSAQIELKKRNSLSNIDPNSPRAQFVREKSAAWKYADRPGATEIDRRRGSIASNGTRKELADFNKQHPYPDDPSKAYRKPQTVVNKSSSGRDSAVVQADLDKAKAREAQEQAYLDKSNARVAKGGAKLAGHEVATRRLAAAKAKREQFEKELGSKIKDDPAVEDPPSSTARRKRGEQPTAESLEAEAKGLYKKKTDLTLAGILETLYDQTRGSGRNNRDRDIRLAEDELKSRGATKSSLDYLKGVTDGGNVREIELAKQMIKKDIANNKSSSNQNSLKPLSEEEVIEARRKALEKDDNGLTQAERLEKNRSDRRKENIKNLRPEDRRRVQNEATDIVRQNSVRGVSIDTEQQAVVAVEEVNEYANFPEAVRDAIIEKVIEIAVKRNRRSR